MTSYITFNHMIFNAFLERSHTETSSFHLSLGEMSITLDGVSCSLHLPISGELLDHGKIRKDEALKLIIDYLGVDSEDEMMEMERTRGDQASFEFLKKLYKNKLLRTE